MILKTDPSHSSRVSNVSKSPDLNSPEKAIQKANFAQFSHQNKRNMDSSRRKLKSKNQFKQMDRLLNQEINNQSEQQPNVNRSSQMAVNGFGDDSTARHMHKNKSEMLQPKRKNNNIALEKLRKNYKPLSNNRYKRIEEQSTGVYVQNQQYGDDNLKQQPRHHQSSELIKSRNKINSLKHNTQNNSLITLTTIKQKIQRYLAQEQSKLKHLKNSNISNPHKHVLHEKANLKLKITQENYQPTLKHEGGVFGSLSSLTRKKQTKFALDMMKRRLNFSVINRSLKDRQAVNFRQKPSQLSLKRKSLNEEDAKKQAVLNKEHLVTEVQSGVSSNVLSTIQNERQQWEDLQKEIIKNLGFKLSNVSGGNSQQMPNSYYKIPSIPLINPIPAQDHSSHIFPKDHSNEKNPLPKEQPTKSFPKQPKNKQYLYNLYYNPNSYAVKKLNNQFKSCEEEKNEKVQPYQDWKRHKVTEENLKQLLKQNTDPVDPIQCYYDAFLKPFPLQTLKPFPTKIHQPKPYLYNSNSPSRSPLGKYAKYHKHAENNKSNSEVGPGSIDQKIIFVTKKQKNNLQHKKLSNLLSKIQKRNNQIQRIGCVHAVEIIKSPKIHKGRKINGLNIQQYIEQNLTLTKPKQDKPLHNFIVQWPKKQEIKEKQVVIKKTEKRKKNADEWTDFQPWIDGTVNENELEGPFKKASERKSQHLQYIEASQ